MDEREFDRKIDGVKVPTRSASPLFTRFGSLGLLLVPQYEEIAGGKEILFKRGSDCGNDCLLQSWTNPIIRKGSTNWSNVGRSV